MTDEEFRARKLQLINEERKNPAGWFYLSFANDEQGFLGGALIQGQGPTTAIDRSHRLRVNPGNCEVLVHKVPPGGIDLIPVEFREKLLSKAELERFVGSMERVE